MADARQQPSYQAQQAERQSVEAELTWQSQSLSRHQFNRQCQPRQQRSVCEFGMGHLQSRTRLSSVAHGRKHDCCRCENGANSTRCCRTRPQCTSGYVAKFKTGGNWRTANCGTKKKVIKAYELQFKIARRTLIDVLDAYAELWNIENTVVAARNDYRDAALAYLNSQAAIGKWAGVVNVDESGSGSPSQPHSNGNAA